MLPRTAVHLAKLSRSLGKVWGWAIQLSQWKHALCVRYECCTMNCWNYIWWWIMKHPQYEPNIDSRASLHIEHKNYAILSQLLSLQPWLYINCPWIINTPFSPSLWNSKLNTPTNNVFAHIYFFLYLMKHICSSIGWRLFIFIFSNINQWIL